jgi:tuberculosinol/isotuberculosinol synthase
MISLDEFLALPTEAVARLIHQAGPQVCVFPINGTRRWFALEHGGERLEYVSIAAHEYIRLFQMLFDHGIDTVLSPAFGGELLRRGDEYVAEALGGIAILESDDFRQFYKNSGVRVRFYGGFTPALLGTPHSDVLPILDRITILTGDNQRHRLFFGLFANDATQAVAEKSVEIYKQTGQIPGRRDLVASYYGEYVEPVSLFIGFDKPSVYDYPLLAMGEEDLYFTVAPSPYLGVEPLRLILFDHIYTRRTEEPDWFTMPASEQNRLKAFYRNNQNTIVGQGELDCDVWLPSVKIK